MRGGRALAPVGVTFLWIQYRNYSQAIKGPLIIFDQSGYPGSRQKQVISDEVVSRATESSSEAFGRRTRDKSHPDRTSVAPVAVRPTSTAQDLQDVQGLLRSFTAQASPCALRLLVNKMAGDRGTCFNQPCCRVSNSRRKKHLLYKKPGYQSGFLVSAKPVLPLNLIRWSQGISIAPT